MYAKATVVLAMALLVGTAQAGFFECGVCQSLLHFWSNARVESTFESVCDAFPNYVTMYPNGKGGATPYQEGDAPKDGKRALPVTHGERCRHVMETLLVRLAEEGIVQVKDDQNAQVFAPTTWENPAILEILCTYVYPKIGEGYCRGQYGGNIDPQCTACVNYLHLAKINKLNNPPCLQRPEADQELCRTVEDRLNALPTGSDTIQGTIRAISRTRDIELAEGRFLACRDFLGFCNEQVDDTRATVKSPTYKQLRDQYQNAYDPYWATRNLYTTPIQGNTPVLSALSTKSNLNEKDSKAH